MDYAVGAFFWPVSGALIFFSVYRRVPLLAIIALAVVGASVTAFFMAQWQALWSMAGLMAQIILATLVCRKWNTYFDTKKGSEVLGSSAHEEH